MDCSLPGSSIHGIFQARVLEWGVIAASKNIYFICRDTLEGLVVDWSDWPLLQLRVTVRVENKRAERRMATASSKEPPTLSLRTEEVGRQRQNILIVNAHVTPLDA